MPTPAPLIASIGSADRSGVLRRDATRWVRPAGLVVLAAVLALGVRTDPRPGLHGTGLVILIALLGVVAGGFALLVDLRARRLPIAALVVLIVVVILGSVALVWIDPNGPGFLGAFVAASAAASRLPSRTGLLVVGLTLIALAVAGVAGAGQPLIGIIVNGLGAVAFYRVGRYARRLRDRTEQAEGLLAELAQTRAAQLEGATLAERQRLAREMHDVLAHSLSGLVLHLEGARLLARRDGVNPQLTDTITRAHALAQTGLQEARQAIGTLRDDELPGPERLPALAEDLERDLGCRCRLTVTGRRTELDPQTRLTLYRVAQEALTNIRKHAVRPCRVEVHLDYESGGTRLTVEDVATRPVRPVAPADDRDESDDGGYGGYGGYGVSGMRERAELLGGTLAATPTGTGFRVTLWVPA